MTKRLLLMLLCALPVTHSLTPQATASPILFTDRAAFDTAVNATVGGLTTVVTFDTIPGPVMFPQAVWTWTIDGVLTFISDSTVGADSVPGTFCLCGMPNGIGGGTISPVLAFGVEITPLAPNTQVDLNGQRYILSQPQFFGFLSSTPSTFGVASVFGTTGLGGLGWSRFTIDNVVVKAVPEPSLLLLLGVGLSSLLGWHLWPARKV